MGRGGGIEPPRTLAEWAGQPQTLRARLRSMPPLITTGLWPAQIEGRLVEQDPDNEPASVLLERIRAMREARATGGKKTKTRQMRLPDM